MIRLGMTDVVHPRAAPGKSLSSESFFSSDIAANRPGGALPPGIDRRGFLRSTAGGALAIAVASVLPGCSRDAGAQGTEGGGLRSLTAAEFETARLAAE